MSDWAALPGTAIPWLLEGDDPSVRYFTLTELLGAAPGDPEVVAARHAIMSSGIVLRILAAQASDGHWEGRDHYYTAKYRGTVGQLIILAALGADGSDERMRGGCEAILRDAQDPESGGFAVGRAKKVGGGPHSSVIPCLTGNLVWSLIRLGIIRPLAGLGRVEIERADGSVSQLHRDRGDPGHGKAGGGSRELRPAGGLPPYVGHPNDLTGGVCVSARAREGVQLLVIALQLRQSLAHRSHIAQLLIVGQRDPATAVTQYRSDALGELAQCFLQGVARREGHGES